MREILIELLVSLLPYYRMFTRLPLVLWEIAPSANNSFKLAPLYRSQKATNDSPSFDRNFLQDQEATIMGFSFPFTFRFISDGFTILSSQNPTLRAFSDTRHSHVKSILCQVFFPDDFPCPLDFKISYIRRK